MPGRRIVALIVLGGALFAAAVHETAAQPPLSTLAATRSCLARLPNAVSGLPPARPPAPPLLFVYALTHDDVDVLTMAVSGPPPRAHKELVAWYGAGDYQGIVLSFFKSNSDARASAKSLEGPYRGKLTGNVVATWAQKEVPSQSVRNDVLGCLSSERRHGPTPSPPAATLATFSGAWGGHTRSLSISGTGRGSESADDGCCTRVYRMTFRIVSVSGAITRATATYRVTSFERYPEGPKGIVKGDVGKLQLRNGIVTNTLTNDYFCSEPAWATTGACGA